jgi:putative sigma-54 modulation protein
MKINVQSVGFTLRQQLADLAQSKVKKLQHLCADIMSVEIQFKLDGVNATANKICNMRLVIPGYDMLSQIKSTSFETAVAKTVEALERQIEKRKKKQRKQLLLQPVYITNQHSR